MKQILLLIFLCLGLSAVAQNAFPPVKAGSVQVTSATGSTALTGSNTVTLSASSGRLQSSRPSGGTGVLDPDAWHQNLFGQAFVFEGNSITANPNGAGLVSYAGIIASGTYTNASWFNGRGTCYIDAVGGAVIGSGTTAAANGPQSFTSTYSSGTSIITLSGAATQTPGYMAVSGSGIQFPCSGTITSGSILTLSVPTTGPSVAGTVRLGGNNIGDRLGQAYPHRPTANGGDGGPRAFLFMADGGAANCLTVGESGTSIILDILAVTGSAEGMGFTPVISPTLPTGYRGGGPTWWTPTQEGQRQIVNSFVRRHEVPGALVVDMTVALSGESIVSPAGTNWTLFDVNGIHPIGYANGMLASYLNTEMLDMVHGYSATPEVVDSPKTFTNGVTIFSGTGGNILLTNPGAYDFAIMQPLLALNSTSSLSFGVNDTDGQQRAIKIKFGYNAATGGGNTATLGFNSANPAVYIYGSGAGFGSGMSITNSLFTGNNDGVTSISINAQAAGIFANTSASPQIPVLILQPNSTKTYGVGIGASNTSNNLMLNGVDTSSGSGSSANFWYLTPALNGVPVFKVDMLGNLTISGSFNGTISGFQKSILRVAGTLVSGTAAISNASISGSNCWPVDNSSGLTNVGSLTVTTSGSTATIRSTNVLDTSPFSLFIAP